MAIFLFMSSYCLDGFVVGGVVMGVVSIVLLWCCGSLCWWDGGVGFV